MNLVDKYKGMSKEDIQRDMKENSLPFAVCMMYIRYDINIGTVVRNANAFGAREVFYYGPRRSWDRRGAVGAHHYVDVSHVQQLPNYEGIINLHALKKKYPHWVALDNVDGQSQDINEHKWKPGTLLFLGEEQCGLPLEILYACDTILHIPQQGSVRSINVGTASGIAMYIASQKLRNS